MIFLCLGAAPPPPSDMSSRFRTADIPAIRTTTSQRESERERENGACGTVGRPIRTGVGRRTIMNGDDEEGRDGQQVVTRITSTGLSLSRFRKCLVGGGGGGSGPARTLAGGEREKDITRRRPRRLFFLSLFCPSMERGPKGRRQRDIPQGCCTVVYQQGGGGRPQEPGPSRAQVLGHLKIKNLRCNPVACGKKKKDDKTHAHTKEGHNNTFHVRCTRKLYTRRSRGQPWPVLFLKRLDAPRAARLLFHFLFFLFFAVISAVFMSDRLPPADRVPISPSHRLGGHQKRKKKEKKR